MNEQPKPGTCPVATQNTGGQYYCTGDAGHEGPCAAVPVYPPPEVLEQPMKQGWKTSEFWLSLFAVVVSGLIGVDWGELGLPWMTKVVVIASVVLTSLGYTVSRTMVKKAEIKKRSDTMGPTKFISIMLVWLLACAVMFPSVVTAQPLPNQQGEYRVHVNQPDFRDESGRFVRTPADGTLFVFRAKDKSLKEVDVPRSGSLMSTPEAATCKEGECCKEKSKCSCGCSNCNCNCNSCSHQACCKRFRLFRRCR